MTQQDDARTFAALHEPGPPLVLYNIWDAGGARALEAASARAVATGSWSVAAAHGYGDGEAIPLDLLLRIAERIAASVSVPVSVDFEGAYAVEPADVEENVRRLIGTGAVGINFEDGVVGGEGVHGIAAQARRVEACRRAGEAEGVALFVNARTDLFLQSAAPDHAGRVEEAVRRGVAYAKAGASGVFVPGLADEALIRTVCETVALPVNVMADGSRTPSDFGQLGVARVSYGPAPYRTAIQDLTERWTALG